MSDIIDLTAREIRDRIQKKKLSARETAQAFLTRIRAVDARIKAFITVFEKEALGQADAVDKKIASGRQAGRLAGVPVAIKDNICIADTPTTCASKILKNYTAVYDAYIIKRLRQEGAVFLGKTNLDEFAMGSSTENSSFFTTRNPWNQEYIPGGSSGGSAACVSARMAPWAVGSDTGGSIRQPASCCGVVGIKPTYGSVSRYGLIAFGSSLDQIGTFARNIEDAALLLQVISGYDKQDSTSLNIPVPDYTAEIRKDVKGLKIGLPKEFFIEGVHAEVRAAVEKAVKILEKKGACVQDISLPHTGYSVAVYYIIAPSEASANLARYDSVKYGYRSRAAKTLLESYEKSRAEGFGDEVKRRIMLGTYALSSGYYDAYYAKAQKVRSLIQKDFFDAFRQVDVIITPTTPTPAFKIGEKSKDPLQMYLSDIFTISCNLAGIPGVSVPCGFSKNHLPVGLQILGPLKGDGNVMRTARAFQEETQFHKEKPVL